MTVFEQILCVDSEGLRSLRSSRRDLLEERQVEPDQWSMSEGPFEFYKRTLVVSESTAPRSTATESKAAEFTVVERTEFKLAIPYWWPLVQPFMTRALKDTNREVRKRWWWSEEVVTQRTAQMFGALAVFGLISGYLGVTIGQTLTFAAEQFGADESAQSRTLAVIRVGVLLSLVALWRGHKIGRRPMVITFAVIAISFSVLGAASTNLLTLGASQTIGRGLTTGLISLIALSITEEVPSASRAVSVAYMAMATAVGSSMVLVLLPLADLAVWGWRLIYVFPVVFLPLVWKAAQHLPETQRFSAAAKVVAPFSISGRRFFPLAFTSFAVAMFISPAAQLRNDFLNIDLGYSAFEVSVFQAVIFAPAGIAMVVSGLIADRKGRRIVGAITLSIGVIMTALSYQTSGIVLWLAATVGAVTFSAFIPAIRVYATELFPTRARARAAGWIDVIGVAGSATGLLVVGWLSARWGGLPPAIGAMALPALLGAVVFLFLPETAKQDLEAFNPTDPKVSKPSGSSVPQDAV